MKAKATSSEQCPRCGEALSPQALGGLCPRCLINLNFASDTFPQGKAQPSVPPPSIEELAPHFPQLELLECLGRGGMGVVYKARQPKLNRLVALKILAPERERDPAFAVRFTHEAQALAKLNHPSIVAVYDFGVADGLYYLLMEFVDGVSLGQLLHSGRLSPREALAIVPQICDALQYAHDAGIVHRDIKPENILLDRKGRVKVADFGLAKLVGADGRAGCPQPAADSGHGAVGTPRPTNTTHASLIMGTPPYMAPEQSEHPSDVDHRADIYSLGVVFYQMLTGELPKGDFAPPSKRVVVDVRLDEVVLRAMEKRPELRYQHVSDVKTMCETIAQAGGLPKNREPEPGALSATVERGRWLLALRAVITCAACAVFGVHLHPPVLGISLVAWGVVGAAVVGRIAFGVRRTREEDRRALERAAMIGLIHAIGMLAAGLLLALINVGLNTEWNYFLAGLLAAGLVVEVLRLAKMALSRRVRGQEVPSPASAPAHLTDTLAEPRFSRTAIVGACFAALGLLMAASVLLQHQVMRAWGGLSLLFGPATILGWIAVTQIRRSAGKLCGLGLAVFDGLLFPLLVLDGVFAGVGKGLVRIFVEFNSNFSNLNNPQVHPSFITRLANFLSQHHELAPLIAVVIMIVVDLLVIRAVWRAVNRPVAALAIAETQAATAAAPNPPLATIAFCAAWASGIFASLTWCLMPHPPQVLIWAILGAALAAVGLAIPVRHSTRGKWALGFGVVQTVMWVIFWLLFELVTPLPEGASNVQNFGSPFVARLQHGTVELLALAPHPSTNTSSWHPDGSPASERFPSRGGSDSAAGKVVREIAFRVRTQAESPSCPELRCDKASGFSGMGSSLKREGTNQTAMIYVQAIACPPEARSTNLKLGVAEGSWETVFSTAKPRTNLNAGWCGEQTSDKTGLWEANIQMTEGKGGDVVLAFNYCSNDDYETRIVYVNADGTAVPLHGNGSYGAGGLTHGITSLSATGYAQINAFQLQRRRYEWVEFRNVSLQPGNKTAVESVNTPGAEISQIFLPASSSPAQEPIQRSAAAASTPALLAEQPKLQFLAWQDEWRAHEPRGAFHADGTAATEPEELRLLRHIQPIGCDDSGSAEGKLNPRFLHLWFSHPLIDRQSLNEVALLDSTGKPLEPRDGMLGSNARGTEDGDRFGWLTHTLSPGYAGNIPTAVTVRLRYSLGPWEHEQMFAPDENGIIALGNGSQFNGIGQNAKGTAFFSIAVDMKQDAARQFGVVAVTKDGRELQPSGGETGGGVGEAVHVQRFIFDTPLAEVAHFRLGTRPVRTVEFRNVPLPVSAAVEADSMLAEQPPVVVETWPVSGIRDVSPGETEIRVRFSKPMAGGSWSWCNAGANSLPEFVGEPHYDADGRTCAIKVKLDVGRTYAIWLNSSTFKNFKDQSGRPAVPYLLIFQTRKK